VTPIARGKDFGAQLYNTLVRTNSHPSFMNLINKIQVNNIRTPIKVLKRTACFLFPHCIIQLKVK
jgi:hypothetical protein